MSRTFSNAIAVIVVTLFTGMALFATVQLAGRIAGPATAGAQAASAQSAGVSNGGGAQGDGSGYGSGSGYGNGSGGYSPDQGTTSPDSSSGEMVCPATGCSASSCHALQ